MLAGRSDNRGARLEAALDVAVADRLDARAVDFRTLDFRTLDFRLDRFEITVSPPHRHGALPEASKAAGRRSSAATRPRSASAERSGQVRGFRYSVGMLNGFGFIRLGAIATLALLCAVPAQGASAEAAYAEARKAFLE